MLKTENNPRILAQPQVCFQSVEEGIFKINGGNSYEEMFSFYEENIP